MNQQLRWMMLKQEQNKCSIEKIIVRIYKYFKRINDNFVKNYQRIYELLIRIHEYFVINYKQKVRVRDNPNLILAILIKICVISTYFLIMIAINQFQNY